MESKRFDVVDALRGFALMGILLLHSIEHFNFMVYPDPVSQSETMMALNEGIWNAMFFMFGGKAYGIFALLFGFTFHLQFARQLNKNIDFGPRFAWRMVLLFGFGLINSMLFPGEILATYALLSPALLLIRKWSNRGVLIFAILSLNQPFELYKVARCYFDGTYALPDYKLGYYYHNAFQNIESGSVLSMMRNAYYGLMVMLSWALGNGRIFQTVGLFALGLYLGRTNMFDGKGERLKGWLAICLVSVVAFIVLLVVHNVINPKQSWYMASLQKLIDAWKNLAQILLVVAIFTLSFYTKLFRRITKPLYKYGRMSLSNYVMQSLVGGILFYPYAFNLAGKLNILYSLVLGMITLVGYVIFCNWWISRYKQGPLEKIWHWLTWVKWSPLEKKIKVN